MGRLPKSSTRRGRIEPEPEVFLDATFLIPLFERDHKDRNKVTRWRSYYAKRHVVTTTIVLAESCNREPSKHRLQELRLFIDQIREDPRSIIVDVDDDLIDRAITLRQENPAWKSGLADCVSFVVMKHFGVTEALTADEHFLEPKFRALLREKVP